MSTDTVANAPDNPIVQIDRKMFERIEDQQLRVNRTELALRSAAEEHKEAKKAHDNASATLTALVAAMVRRVNGETDGAALPLFDNQTDAIDAATKNPVVSKLIDRMLGHNLTHVNALIVAGYDHEQRQELTTYLDALDLRVKAEAARVNAEAEGQTDDLPEVPEAPEMPAFLAPVEISEEEVGGALREVKIDMKKKHIRLMSQDQRRQALEYSAGVQAAQLRLGEAVTYDDLPPAPSFIISPKELEAQAHQDELETADGAEARTPESAPKKARAPRRSSKEFKNTPRIASKVKKAKGNEAVN